MTTWVSARVARTAPAPRAPGSQELDELTLAAASRGERTACIRFVAMYERRVFAAIGRILGPQGRQAWVQDVAQECFLRALRALPRFRSDGPAKLSTWLLTIATRQALTELGRRKFDACSAEPDLSGQDSAADPERLHHRDALEQAIAQLTPEQRAVFVLRDYHGLTETEVAEALGLELPAVKSRLFRARARLRKLLTSHIEGTEGTP